MSNVRLGAPTRTPPGLREGLRLGVGGTGSPIEVVGDGVAVSVGGSG
jgi:hypothetical protein